jgi:hypothetical protein
MTFPSIVPVIVVTILNIFLGMLWYSPLLLGTMWAKAYKFDMKKLKPTSWHYIGSIFISLITALIVSVLIYQFEIMTWLNGMLLGIYLWVGFIATTHFSGVIWAHKPLRVYFIDVAYHLVSLVMMGTFLAVWL